VDAAALAGLVSGSDAVFLGLGLGPDSRLRLPGEDLPGVEGAVDWIERMKTGTVSVAGVIHAAVIGGGNTAMDCVRELRTLGVGCVRLVYRGSEADMSGYEHEWEAAKVQGTEAVWHAQPVGFVGTDAVAGVRCVVTDANKQPIPGREFIVDAELVLVATGQAKLGQLVAGIPGVETEKGRIVVDARGRTGHPKVFAGGDCANGGKEVVNAVAEGRDAARAIHEMLSGGL
jgi:glutamate synthase (NADPH/NADH) small chain